METYAQYALLLSLERLTYGVVWKKPQVVSEISKVAGMQQREPEMIYTWVRLFKLIQIYVFSVWYYSHYGTSLPSLGWMQFLLGVPLLAFGQILNASVWYRIGIEGVCYGCKFGRQVPWCVDFPYSHFNHPQYLGAILTVWGMFIFSWNDCSDWWALPAIETALYTASMYSWEA